MNARQFFKRPLTAGGTEAPTEAPPTTKPGVEPARPDKSPDEPETPWRRRDVEPGQEPAPKAAYGMDQTYTDSNARQVIANLLEDDKGC
jgi:hypothetical protein